MPVALLTGVGREGQVGEAVAARLASDGFDLLLVDRTLANVTARAEVLRAGGYTAQPYACDLADATAVSSLAAAIGTRGQLDALVHMAGGFGPSGPVGESDLDAWDRQLTINLRTAFLTARAVIPMLRKTRGSIVMFASESALDGAKLSRISGYAVAKTGVVTLGRAIAQEELRNGLRCNMLAPGSIRTASNTAAMGSDGPFVERDDVAAAVAFLCSEASRAITGQVIRLTPR